VTAKYTTSAKYGQPKEFLSPYMMLPIVLLSVSNIDIAKSKWPINKLIVAAY
jgi:hypothetical protein